MKLIAVTSDFETCECCGRTGLKKVAVVIDDEGNVLYLGTTCAATKLGKGGSKKVKLTESVLSDKAGREYAVAQIAKGRPYSAYLKMALETVKKTAAKMNVALNPSEALQLARTYINP